MDSPRWELEITRPAERDLRRLSAQMQYRVAAALDGLTVMPRRGDIKKLEGADSDFRLRVGDWRVIFRPDLTRRVVIILAIRHRGAAYRG